MKNADREGFEAALRECANERIHQIGQIQPHGATLVFEADELHMVRQISENLADFLDLPSGRVVGQSLATLLGEAATLQVLSLVRVAEKKQTAAGVLQLTRKGESVQLQAHLYAAGGQWALELEHDDESHQENQLAQLQLQFQQTLLEFESDDDLIQYFNEVAKLVRKLTGYDSVMVYRFNARWDGEVVAQDRVEAAPSYLGLHFPASDIPPQARRLYAANLVRIVADVNAQPVPISPALNEATGEPLDMTYSALRSLSPIHLEYLRNIGVSASMVISLKQEGQLWGMIACHHKTPKRVSLAVRESAIFISRMISVKLSGIAALEQRAKVDQAGSLVNELVKSIATHFESVTLLKLLPRLIQVVDATGVIVVIDGQPHMHGAVPDDAAVRTLLAWLSEQPTAAEVFTTDELGKQFASALSYADVASGLLTTALNQDMRNGIVWLRKEKPRTVKWAGNYQTGLSQNAAGNFRLTPRKSFEIWTETWQGRSEPWSRADISNAAMLSLSVPDALSKKHKLEVGHAKFRQAHLVSTKSVQQFNKLTGAIPGVVYQFLITPEGGWTFLYMSAYVRELYEVTPEDAYRDHKALTSCIVAEHRDSHDASVQNAYRTLTPWVHEYMIQTPSGARKWVLGQALPEAQTDGSVLWHGILTDVTERWQSVEILRRNQIMLACTEEIAHIGSWEWDVATDTTIWSNELFGIFRIDPASGAPSFAEHHSLYPPDDMQRLSDAVAVALNNGTSYELELRAIRKDGAIRLCLATGVVEIGVDNKVTRLFGSLQDITERKQAELELVRSKNQYQGILNNMIDAYWRVDMNGRIVEANQAICQMLGYSKPELLRMSIADVEVIESAEDTRKHIETIMREGHDTFESQHRCRDGRVIDVEISASQALDAPGNIDAFHRNITERKRAEDAMRLTASVFAHTREGITVTDVQGSILDVNAAFCRITGYDRADVLGQNPRILQSGKQDNAFYIAMWCELISQGYWEGEIWNRRKNGEIYPERLTIAAVRDAQGNTQQYVAMFSDVTQRKRIELELMKSEQKFRLIAENTSDGITIFNGNRTIQYVSPSVMKQLGYSEQEELGRSSADVYALLDPQGRDALFQTINEAIQKKIEALTYSYRIKHKAGHYIWREDSTNFRYTSTGDYDGAYVVSRDITERKRLEEEVRQLAYFDPLTHLPNRRLLNDRLGQAMAASKRSGHHAAVMVLDLDNFKPLNDQHGHLVGDLLLIEVARRLLACVREVDTVARFGGDEFVVMLSELDADSVASHRLALSVAEKIRLALSAPYVLSFSKGNQPPGTVEHHCSASIGMVLFINHETAQEDILKWADAAMYQAKDAGRNVIRVYEPNANL